MHHSMLLRPLLFRLGSTVLLLHHIYLEYLRTANANEARLPCLVY